MTNQATPRDESTATTGPDRRRSSQMSRRARVTVVLWVCVTVALSAVLLAGQVRRTQSNTTRPLSTLTTVIARDDQQNSEHNGRYDESLGEDAVGSVPALTIASEFEPENGELSNCVGSFAERPGCGATGRGGRGQTLVLVALLGGLVFIGWRIFAGAKKQQRSRQRANPRASHRA